MTRPSRLLAIGFSALVLLLAAGFLARTQWIAGPAVQARLLEAGRKMGADLEVGSLKPLGLYSLRLERVALRVPRGPFTIEATFPRVDVTPSLMSLLRGEPALARVRVREGDVVLVPQRRVVARPKSSPKKASAPRHEAPPAAAPAKKPTPFELDLHDLRLHLRGKVVTASPIRVARASATAMGSDLRELSAYGTLPDGTPFMASSDGEGKVKITPETSTRVDRWLEPEPPVSLAFDDITICRTCEEPVAFNNLELGLPVWRDDIAITAPSASFVRRLQTVELQSPEMAIINPDTRAINAGVTRTRIQYDSESSDLQGRIQLADPKGGTLDLDWSWSGRTFDVTLWANEFDLDSIWRLFPVGDLVEPGTVHGTLRLELDLTRRLAFVESALRFQTLSVQHRFLAKEPLVLSSVGVAFDALFDAKGRAFSLSRGKLTLGALAPVFFHGQVVDAGDGWSFFLETEADDLDALLARDVLPDVIARPAEGALLDGSFGFRFTVGGHTSYTDSLLLDGGFRGEVRVLQDSAAADVQSLRRPGAPATIEDEAKRASWTSYHRLGWLVPKVLLAAEDATFFQHDGFDFPGLRRAMIHNLEVRALERGGSTISQQVVKNLFLSGERTLTRKLQEAYLTWRLESELSKERILEIYLNIAPWGGGAVGVVEAARRYFDADSRWLHVIEMSMLAAILPGPQLYGPVVKAGYLPSSRLEKMKRILANLRWLKTLSAAQYTRYHARIMRGQIGRIRLEICRDDEHAPADAPDCREVLE